MQPLSNGADRYDALTIGFHWATAILVVAQWVGAQTIDWFPRGPLRVNARSVHIVAGVLLAALIAARLLWRVTGGRRLPLADEGALNLAAKGTHWGLYALLIAMVGRACSSHGRVATASSTCSASRPTTPATAPSRTGCRRCTPRSAG